MSKLTYLAAQLWRCRYQGGVIEVPADGGPVDLKTALMIQRHAIANSEMASIGYKVGSTSKEAQKVLGTREPNASPILSAFYYDSPAKIGIDPAQGPAVEGEFALRMRCDLPPRKTAYSLEEVSDAIGAVAGAIEVVGSRFVGGLSGKGPLLTTADFGANIALVVGPWNTNWHNIDLAAQGVEVLLNKQSREKGTGERALGNPLNVIQWLANDRLQTEQGLKTGDIISTGTCTGLLDVLPGNTVVAKFGSLGSVKISFTKWA